MDAITFQLPARLLCNDRFSNYTRTYLELAAGIERYWTGTSMQVRLMQESLFKCK